MRQCLELVKAAATECLGLGWLCLRRQLQTVQRSQALPRVQRSGRYEVAAPPPNPRDCVPPSSAENRAPAEIPPVIDQSRRAQTPDATSLIAPKNLHDLTKFEVVGLGRRCRFELAHCSKFSAHYGDGGLARWFALTLGAHVIPYALVRGFSHPSRRTLFPFYLAFASFRISSLSKAGPGADELRVISTALAVQHRQDGR